MRVSLASIVTVAWSVTVASGIAGATGCGKAAQESGGTAATPGNVEGGANLAADVAQNSGAATVPDAGANPPGTGAMTIGGRMQAEAAGRTHVKPDVDDVLTAFEKASLKLGELKQGVAHTSRAQFCEFGTTPGGHRVLVCEYEDAAHASEALPFLRAQLVDPRRRVEARGRLTLTVFVTTQTPDSDRESARYFELFTAAVP